MNQTILIGRESDLVFSRIQTHDGILLSLGLISAFFSFLFLLATYSLKRGNFFPYFGLYFFTSLLMFCQSPLFGIFLHKPLFITHLVEFSIAMILLFVLQISRRFVRKKEEWILKYIVNFYSLIILYLILFLVSSSWERKYQIFYDFPLYGSILFCDLLIPILILRNSKKLQRSQFAFLVGILALDFGNIPQVLSELNLVSSYPQFYFHLGVLVFILSIAYSAYDTLLSLYKLMEASKKNLKGLVMERTRDLEDKQTQILELEKKIVKKKTEESILADFHDQIGGHILDLKAMLLNQKKNELEEFDLLRQVDLIALSLRERINLYEDKELMRQDFFTGLRAILFHRYGLYKRRVLLKINESNASLDFFPDETFMTQNLSIFSEVVNNDLKYGISDSISQFTINYESEKRILTIHFDAKTSYRAENPGHGKKSLRTRVLECKGTIDEKITGEDYTLFIEIQLPSRYSRN